MTVLITVHPRYMSTDRFSNNYGQAVATLVLSFTTEQLLTS